MLFDRIQNRYIDFYSYQNHIWSGMLVDYCRASTLPLTEILVHMNEAVDRKDYRLVFRDELGKSYLIDLESIFSIGKSECDFLSKGYFIPALKIMRHILVKLGHEGLRERNRVGFQPPQQN